MSRRAGLSTPVFLLSTAIGIAIFVLALVVIGVRIDSGPPVPPPPSAAEQARQDAASAYLLLAEAAEADPDSADLATMARAHEEAVGGVWVPWPGGPPEGATNPPAPRADTDDVSELLIQSIDATEEALETAEPADAPLYASILIRQQAALDTLSEGEERGLSAEPLSPSGVAALASEQTLIEIDTARQWLESAAPHLENPEQALLRIDLLEDYTNAILDTGMTDSRYAFAPLPDWFLEDPSAQTALRLEEEADRLVASELFTYIPTQDSIDLQIVATVRDLLPAETLSDFPLLEEMT